MNVEGRYTHLAIERKANGSFGKVRFVGDTFLDPSADTFTQAKSWFKDASQIILISLADAQQYTATEVMTTVWEQDE